MLKISRKTVLAATFLLSSLSSVFAGFEEEKDIIDRHSPLTHKEQIADVVKYSLAALEEKNDPQYERALVRVGLKQEENISEEEFDEGDDVFVKKLGGLFLLNKYAQRENPTGVDVLEVTEVASMLLSPEVFSEDHTYPHSYVLYDTVFKRRSRFAMAGLYQQEKIPEDLVKEVGEVLDKNPGSRRLNTISAKYFDPIILLGKDAIFSDEGYVYALSKGKFLHGLDKEDQWVHGGIIQRPGEVFVHDQAHNNDILGVDDDKPEQEIQAVSEAVQTLASRFYALINNEEVFLPEERKMAFRAAAYFFHENEIEKSSSTLHKPIFFDGTKLQAQFEIIYKRWDTTFQKYFQVVDSPIPPSLMSEEDKRMLAILAKINGAQEEQNPYHFSERFASDTAKQICEIYPEAEVEIFGDETDAAQDRNYVYHGPNVLKWNQKLMSWFAEKVRSHL